MSDSYLKRSQEFTVALDEVDYREHLKPSAIMQFFQDLATEHAKDLGIGFEEMKKKNFYWIMSRLSYRIYRYPEVGEKIIVTTYPEEPRMVDANRSFYINDDSGALIASGRSKWCVIDIDSRRIQRCDVLFNFDKIQYIPTAPFEDSLQKLAALDGRQELLRTSAYSVKITDLDRNMHMNNARYGDAVLNSCDIDMFNNKRIASFDINFLSELKFGELFNVLTISSENETSFEATKTDGALAFRARIGWCEE